MSPASLGICEKLFRRWELKTSLTEGYSARRAPNRPSQYAFGSARSPITEHHWGSDREAVPPDHAPPGITVVAHMSVPSRITMESPVGALSSTPPRDSKKGWYSVLLLARRGMHKQQQETYPQPEGAGKRPSHSPE
ncbi:hypothetical protein L3Q82_013499 [Scortum barcoo]|uniref:Uncharacterized protein n=1 Tax=Scortum barcoo TaxID=214431 RepID=A0ACB8W0I5_9TELE|nr:hypothetical protein L3Q82_013499 [Scortum barcoo]